MNSEYIDRIFAPSVKSTHCAWSRNEDRVVISRVARHEPLKELDGAANAPYREDPIMA